MDLQTKLKEAQEKANQARKKWAKADQRKIQAEIQERASWRDYMNALEAQRDVVRAIEFRTIKERIAFQDPESGAAHLLTMEKTALDAIQEAEKNQEITKKTVSS